MFTIKQSQFVKNQLITYDSRQLGPQTTSATTSSHANPLRVHPDSITPPHHPTNRPLTHTYSPLRGISKPRRTAPSVALCSTYSARRLGALEAKATPRCITSAVRSDDTTEAEWAQTIHPLSTHSRPQSIVNVRQDAVFPFL